MAEAVKAVAPALGRRLAAGAAWAAFGQGFLAVKGILLYALLARLLQPAELGTFFIAQSAVVIGSTCGLLGLNKAVVRFIARDAGQAAYRRAARVAGSAIGLAFLGGVGSLVAFRLVEPLLSLRLLGAPLLHAVAPLVGAWILVSTLEQILAECFRGLHDIRSATVYGGVVSGVLGLGGLIALHSFGSARFETVLSILVAAVAANAVVAGAVLWLRFRSRIRGLPSDPRTASVGARDLLRTSIPMLATAMALLLFAQTDLWILGTIGTEADVGFYGAAARLATVIGMPLVVVNLTVAPLIADMYVHGSRRQLERLLRGTATAAAIPASIVFLAFALFGSRILAMLYGPDYGIAVPALLFLGFGLLVGTLTGSNGTVLMMTGHERALVKITGLAGVTGIGLAALGAQTLGFMGVAIAVAVAMVMRSLGCLLAAKRLAGVETQLDLAGLWSIPGRIRSRRALTERYAPRRG